MIDHEDIRTARRRIDGRVLRTPQIRIDLQGRPLWLKLEFLQHTGSFKARGAFNRILAADEDGTLDPTVGIVAASGGNAGLANAYAAARLGIAATVFVPETAPAVKVNRLHTYGATVRQVGSRYSEAYAAAQRYADETGAVFCHAYDQIETAAGAGSIAEEILEDEPRIDTIVVAVGGGGLYAGVATAAGDRAKVVAVEPATIATLNAALAADTPMDVEVSGIAADSLGATRIGSIAFDVASRFDPVSLLVSDADIVDARNQLWREYRIAAEHGAATAFAALTSGVYKPAPNEHVAVVVCGANTNPATLDDTRHIEEPDFDTTPITR
ncbi:threonine dehydratase [Rhodococcus sp. 27YEA15]|uniref:threonine/serine dehydratase n=1 Tax=Rhodococcus sp. 27YEA15 TaxID=3156259 RepID=UPI003C7E70C3